jgi:hypothetical protein
MDVGRNEKTPGAFPGVLRERRMVSASSVQPVHVRQDPVVTWKFRVIDLIGAATDGRELRHDAHTLFVIT